VIIYSCGINIPITIHAHYTPIQRTVTAREGITILLYTIATIPVTHNITIIAQDLLFELDKTLLSLFTSLTDNKLSMLIAHNESDQPVHIPARYKLSDLIELDCKDCFQVSTHDTEI
jgi:hypothetical protein